MLIVNVNNHTYKIYAVLLVVGSNYCASNKFCCLSKGGLRYKFSPFVQNTVILGCFTLARSWSLFLCLLRRLQLETFIMLLSLEMENCLVCSLML